MQQFAEQCTEMARSMLGHNLASINQDGTITPIAGEEKRFDEPGHAALAIGEFYRATGETELDGHDLIDLAARCITAQTFIEPIAENGVAYAALALLSFGPAKDRNPVWERLVEETRLRLDRLLLARSDHENHWQAFNIAKAVTRFSMGLSKKDETGKLIDRFLERIGETNSGNFHDDSEDGKGVYNIYGVLAFTFIRQAIQLHANIHLRDRKLPSLRTHAEKYLRLLPDLVREDGLGWSFGRGGGAYGQMYCISLILQGFRDNWIVPEKQMLYFDILRRLFYFFYLTYLDQEHGNLIIRDGERETTPAHTTRMADFDGARYLSQWARLARTVNAPVNTETLKAKNTSRFVIFDKSSRKEQGLFIYKNAESGLHINIPLTHTDQKNTSDSLAFPHSPGIFDWPVNKQLPVMIPELKFGDRYVIPSYYGKRCTTGMGLRKSIYFRYEQPDLIDTNQEIVSGLGSCKVNWTFNGGKVTSEFIFTVKQPVTMERMRYMLVIASPHSLHRVGNTFTLGQEGLRCTVLKDDFQAQWAETEVVTDDPNYKTMWGNIHYLQTLVRDHPLNMRPGQQYRLSVAFEPDLARADG
ncbi:MAG: hypothetical protein O3C43_12155 [Verrucomicrobia bacterium]|nr:hypothetical protein [Verrucomicrobiota bacterium]MDA1067245.1 hypothetical protein [Verrucomicrobiota bacterium]